MDKYEYKVRADEIKELIAQGDYAQAVEIADTIDWRRVKSVMMLCTISDLYKINRRYEDARDMLLLAYDRRPGGRTICYSLCELSIKMEEFVQAVEYYKEFVQVAPKDPGRYILQYKLYEAQDVSLEERIEVLEELKKRDYREKWAYQLAYLYHRVGFATRCVEECDEMILWFGEGKYVIKAMELKRLHEPLTPEQQQIYNNRFGVEKSETVSTNDTDNAKATVETNQVNNSQMGMSASNVQVGDETKIYKPVQIQELVEAQNAEDLDIHVKTMDVGQYNTMNLQAELAEGLREVLGEERGRGNTQKVVPHSIAQTRMESDTEFLDGPQIDEVNEEDLEPEVEEIESSEVFFGETGEIGDLYQNGRELSAFENAMVQTVPDLATKVMTEQMFQGQTQEAGQTLWSAEPPKELANVLSQESDGQLSLVMPEKESIEKQITGQMSIDDILAEWERIKKDSEEKRKEEVCQHVLQQTDNMFTEFEVIVRDGLLEQLENGEIDGEEAVKAAEAETIKDFYENVDTQDAFPETEDIVWDVEEVSSEDSVAQLPEETIEALSYEEADEVEELEEIQEINPTELEASTEVEEKPTVVRDKAKIRALTREERELYAPFVQSRSAREQLVQAVDNISLAAYTGNIIITGEEGMDTLALAKNMIREVQMEDSNFSGKVAKISANVFNEKEVSSIVGNLKNGALIILKASEMNYETANALNKSLQQENEGIIVVLIDTKKAMNLFLSEHKELHSCFTARMDMEALSNDTLVAFGRQYAREMEYSIDEMGVLALHTKIANMQTSDHIVTVVEVKRMVDNAIHRANKKTVGHFFDILLAKRYDDEDMIILGEKDFV